MSNRSYSHTKASDAKSSDYLPTQAISSRPFALQTKALETDEPMTDFAAQKSQASQLDAGLMNNLGIQPKLTIGEPNDKYEQEADSVAAKVVQQINSPQAQAQAVQREAMPDEEELQMKPMLQREEMPEEEELQMKPVLQREEMPEEEELQMKPMAQRETGNTASADFESTLNSAKGGGQSLDENMQQAMGQSMGADFSGVRVHTDSVSDQLNQSVQAKAFTTGQDVFFRQGEYQPGSRSGQELLAHELTHVVQQGK